MQINEIQKLMNEDVKINRSELSYESLRTSELHNKYYKIMMLEIIDLQQLKYQYQKLKKIKFEYYLGKCNDEVYEEQPLHIMVKKVDLDIYMESDEELMIIDRKIFLQKTKVDMLQDFIKNVINTRGFAIRDAIAFEQFKNGQ